VHLRATGAGVIAGSSKFGGILGAIGGVMGAFNDMTISSIVIALPMVLSAVMLFRSGIDTRSRTLEEIQDAMTKQAS
jgi:putative MFS transporter